MSQAKTPGGRLLLGAFMSVAFGGISLAAYLLVIGAQRYARNQGDFYDVNRDGRLDAKELAIRKDLYDDREEADGARERFSAQVWPAYKGWLKLETEVQAALKSRATTGWDRLSEQAGQARRATRALRETSGSGAPQSYSRALDECVAKLGEIVSARHRKQGAPGSYTDEALVADMKEYVELKRALRQQSAKLSESEAKRPR